MNNIKIKSPLKWAGGKKDLVGNIQFLLSEYIDNRNYIENFRLVEPFCGGLSVSLNINNNKIKSYWCNDINKSLINLYNNIKEANKLNELLLILEELNASDKNNKEEYYKTRHIFNINKKRENLSINHSADFIYLNKRCFNGLYRENSSGEFNVPYGENKTSIYDRELLLKLNDLFNRKKFVFTSENYKYVFENVESNDIIYIDPPYYPKDGKSSFTQYHSSNFLIDEQKELASIVKKLDQQNIPFVLSNTPCEEVEELYSDFYKEELRIVRDMRNAIGKTRANSAPNEILITNIFKLI